ncbi:23S rRNA (guanine(745)-N(1))-methyltransferase [Motilimonas cestriensis]|uniref:23S rRNA (Guanine(745)-N(1))-methyltransferase n=1 Tax=Motilimonas cestriensis TaxID=2742685 RepID=A0ABS8W844_9GAMM|nr:23S rRNA (guanine(745)-N(1))-methyltransferase [Motilimonas cestriensis]MCE2593928.1 23S rRNA (guanine(745)-N(1))-methyltransferase [Motilimonas cestriensis]
MLFICPLCQAPLSRDNSSARCPQNHCFDFAKEGYLNLLPVQKKNSIDPGDNKMMMQARRDFLNKGFYQPLAEQVALLIKQQMAAKQEHIHALDLGCGEGYYCQYFTANTQANISWHGLDISKSAIRYAAKRAKSIQFCIASAFDLPFAGQQFDCITRIYAPSDANELQRVLKNDGCVISVSPGPRHLFQLKQAIYDTPQPHSDAPSEIEGLMVVEQVALTYPITLTHSQDIANLLEMTPFAYKLTATQKQQLSSQSLTLDLDFKIEVFKKQV